MTFDFGETIYQKLAMDTSIYAMVYAVATGMRIFPVKMPDNVVYPAISFQIVGGASRLHTMGSDTGNPAGTRVQISAWAETLTEARDLAELIRLEMQDSTGLFINLGDITGITFQRIFTETDALEFYAAEAEVYHVVRDYLVWWNE
jgi:hypothetical protein